MRHVKKNAFRVFLLLALLAVGLVCFASASVPSWQSSQTVLRLNKLNQGENESFEATNMLPGDEIMKVYRLKVSYRENITVHFESKIHPGYEKLAEVLMVKVNMWEGNNVAEIYKGLLRDMPAVETVLNQSGWGTDELCYTIVVFLDTSVGNSYQGKEFYADLSWWVNEPGSLILPPETGAYVQNYAWVVISALLIVTVIVILVLIIHRRKEERT